MRSWQEMQREERRRQLQEAQPGHPDLRGLEFRCPKGTWTACFSWGLRPGDRVRRGRRLGVFAGRGPDGRLYIVWAGGREQGSRPLAERAGALARRIAARWRRS